MHDIIPIIDFHGQEGINAVSAKALYTYLFGEDVNRNYAKWAETYVTTNEWAVRGEDWVCVTSDANPQGGRPSQDYHLRIDFAKHIALQSRSDKGQEVRAYFIAVEKRARAPLAAAVTRKDLALMVLAAEEALEKAGALIAAQAPLVAFAEKVQGSPSSYTVDVTAKELGFPVKAFREFAQGKYLFRRGRDWMPYEEYGQNGRKWFEVRTRTYDQAGIEITYHTTLVTGLGRIKLKEAWERSHALAVPG